MITKACPVCGGECKVCGESFTEILLADCFSEITPGSRATAESDSLSFHNGIKMLEEKA